MTRLDELISEATIIRPGDTLFIVLRSQLTPEEFDRVQKQIAAGVPENIQTIVMSGEIHLSVLRPYEVAR